ncbi:MAG: hypothetical protein ACTH3D_09145 [Halomonas sp.]|uniref:hypothetical protein n=1 Tax=Halomonas sp. TaxID=1486246 RepID=UPI003F8F654A
MTLNKVAHPQTPVEHHQETDTTMAVVFRRVFRACFMSGFKGLQEQPAFANIDTRFV